MGLAKHRAGTLHVEEISLVEIAEKYGTPCYVYSRRALTEAYGAYRDALASHNGGKSLICYAVKANSNLAILNLFARLGAGFDIVSAGELARVLAAGGEAQKVVFSGVGKSRSEIATALRVNPDVDAKTHPYISTGLKTSKFGIAYEDALPLYRKAAALPNIRIVGIDCHIGSQLLDPAPAAEAAQKILHLVDALAAEGITLEHIDIGGGMGIRYKDETVPSASEYLAPILQVLKNRKESLLLEPGRSLVGNAGLLLTRVEGIKTGSSNFVVVDAAMNDLMRPALYDAWHDIMAVQESSESPRQCEVVGPVCESGDFLGHDRSLSANEGDLLAILSAGAYGMTMSSNYNSRPRAAEIMVDAGTTHLIRKREEIQHLFAGESTLP